MKEVGFMKTILFLLVIFFANGIQAITGFAGTVLAMPPSILLVGLEDAKVVLAVMALLSCLFISIQQRKDIHKKEVITIVGFMFVGILLGNMVFSFVPSEITLPLYGTLVTLVGIQNLVQKKKMVLSQNALYVVLLVAGIVHGLFVSGGAFLVIYATQKFPEKAVFRGTVSTVWVVLNSFLLFSYGAEGLFNAENFSLICYSIPPLIVATYLGTALQKRINQKVFLTLTYVLLIISGMSLVI